MSEKTNILTTRWYLLNDNLKKPQPLQPEQIIGRTQGTILFPDDAAVSAQHARLQVSGNEVTLTDLGSTNGTLVNGVDIDPDVPVTLKSRDWITVGVQRLQLCRTDDVDARDSKPPTSDTNLSAQTFLQEPPLALRSALGDFFKLKHWALSPSLFAGLAVLPLLPEAKLVFTYPGPWSVYSAGAVYTTLLLSALVTWFIPSFVVYFLSRTTRDWVHQVGVWVVGIVFYGALVFVPPLLKFPTSSAKVNANYAHSVCIEAPHDENCGRVLNFASTHRMEMPAQTFEAAKTAYEQRANSPQ